MPKTYNYKHFSIMALSKDNLQNALSFVLQYEPYCVSLCDILRKAASGMQCNAEDIFLLAKDEQIQGILHLHSTLHHCIPNPTQEMKPLFAAFFSDRALNGGKVQCINGEATATSFIRDTLQGMGQCPQQTNHYILLTMPSSSSPCCPISASAEGFIAVHCTLSAATIDALMPLEEAYQKEEVIPNCRTFSLPAARLSLEKALHDGRVMVLADNLGGIAAKASLNAVGFNCVQLGGVYTVPAWRHHGLARALVSSIINDALRMGKQTVLYAREENKAALGLYQGLGMKAIGQYSIVYY